MRTDRPTPGCPAPVDDGRQPSAIRPHHVHASGVPRDLSVHDDLDDQLAAPAPHDPTGQVGFGRGTLAPEEVSKLRGPRGLTRDREVLPGVLEHVPSVVAQFELETKERFLGLRWRRVLLSRHDGEARIRRRRPLAPTSFVAG
jgi:hypothetical protein